ncbi:MAG: hypothetical protein H6737_06520 [Alphaproteobacteria bacterium]|nr:hypothetical protein [Alphaproteobacteria bacterium]
MSRSRWLATKTDALRERLERGRPRPIAVAALLSLFVHALGAVGLAQVHLAERTEPRVLQVAFVSHGEQEGDKEAGPTEPVEPTPADAPVAAARPSPKTSPAPVAPQPVEVGPELPEVRFPALARAAKAPAKPVPVEATKDFASWQKARMAHVMPSRIPDGGGSPDGTAAVDSEGTDRCVPAPGRQVERLYLLFDSSGSMSDQLRAQALSCAQQYASAVIDGGGVVVVGNFARAAKFFPATRSMTDVAFALREDADPRATVLPSRELNPFFDQDPGARADLVILSDGYIPNFRDVLPWYRYFVELDPENRGYLYTLGAKGHPEVTEALRRIGFDIYVYRIL